MARIVPSQVVDVIDQLYPIAAAPQPAQRDHFQLSRDNPNAAGKLATIVNMTEQVPNELFTLDARHYAALRISITEIKHALATWPHREYLLKGIHEFDDLHPLALIRNALVTCPDEFPSAGTSELIFIQDQEFRAHLALDISGMNRALFNGEWKAATVLAGSIVEALLLWALQQEDPAKRETAITNASGNALRQRPPEELEQWHLHQFIEVAAEGRIISADTAYQVRLAKDFRNLIHPGRASRLGQMCDRGTALAAVGAVELVVRDLTP
jgi:hypothetical protein